MLTRLENSGLARTNRTYSEFLQKHPQPDVMSTLGVSEDSPITAPVKDGSEHEPVDYTKEILPVLDESFVNTLTDIASRVRPVLESPVPTSLRQDIDQWCDLYGIESECESTWTVIARQAVLNLWLKCTLYEKYHQCGKLPALTTDIRAKLRGASELTENAVFNEYILDKVIWHADYEDIAAVVDERTRLLKSTQPAEEIGWLYESLTESESRQTLSQFRSPTDAASLMRFYAVCGGDCVLDPGMGAGVLSSPFHPRWEFASDPANVIGIDRSPLSNLMGVTALTLYHQSHESQTVNFLELTPGDLSREVDSIVCNPPYTKADQIQTPLRDDLDHGIGSSLHGKSPLYAYFVWHATTFLDDGDRFAALLPRAWMSTNYGEDLKQMLLENYRIEAVIGTASHGIIEQADVNTVILLLERSTDTTTRRENTVSFLQLRESLAWVDEHIGFNELLSMLDEPDTDQETAVRPVQLSQDALCIETNWSRYLRTPKIYTELIESQLTSTLQDFASVSLGMTSGCNAFFYFDEDDAESTSISSKHLQPLIKSPTDCSQYSVVRKEIRKRVLMVDELKSNLEGTAVHTYIQDAEAEGIHNRPAVAQKSAEAWHINQAKNAPLLQPRHTSQRHFTCYNETGAAVDKGFLCIDPDDEDLYDIVFSYLNSTIGVLIKELFARRRGSGALSMTVSDLQQLPVFDLTQLTEHQRAALQEAAVRLKEQPIHNIQAELGATDPELVSIEDIREPRRTIDTMLMGEVFGLSQEEQLCVYRAVLRLLTDRLGKSQTELQHS